MRPACAAVCSLFFFFNDTATTEIYTLSLHDALPIYLRRPLARVRIVKDRLGRRAVLVRRGTCRSEEHTSELQSQSNLVCRLLLEKKKTNRTQEQFCQTLTPGTTLRTTPP